MGVQVVHENIMRWLYTLHLRAPGATVILVANKCDSSSLGDFKETTGRVEIHVKQELDGWQERRRSKHSDAEDSDSEDPDSEHSDAEDYDAENPDSEDSDAEHSDSVDPDAEDMKAVRLQNSVSRISCKNYGGIADLKDRIFDQDAASIQVPPAWDLALKVVEALRTGGDPLHVARKHLGLNHMGATGNKIIKLVATTFTTKDQLLKLWHDIVGEVSGELRGAKKAAVSNPDSALNGALWIR